MIELLVPNRSFSARVARALVVTLAAAACQVDRARDDALAGPAAEREGLESPYDARPNVVVILADDLGWSDISPYGGEIETPVLQRLADDGLRFTQFYNTGRCCPTRASLLTGLYPHQAGVGHMTNDKGWDAYRGDLGLGAVTIAEVLGEAGYHTWMTGKWHVTRHLGHWTGRPLLTLKHNWPIQRGFDRFWGTIHGAGSYYDPVSLTDGNTPIQSPRSGEFYYTDAIAERAAAFIRDHAARGENQPFFGYVAFTAPHWPLHALPEDIERYDGRYDEGWEAHREARFLRQREMGLLGEEARLSPHEASWEEAEHKAWQKRAMEVYAAMVDRMDQGIGEIVEALEETGHLQNTIVLFLADNGGCAEGGTAFDSAVGPGQWISQPKFTRDGRLVHHGEYRRRMPGPEDTYQEYGRPWSNLSNTPFRLHKHWVHEGGIASPFVVHWPMGRLEPGALRTTPSHLVDLMATFVDVGRAEWPARHNGQDVLPMEGTSLLPVFASDTLPERALFWEHEGNRAVRLGDWKLVSRHRKENRVWELYDLSEDRSELNDLLATHPEKAAELEALYEAWAERAGVRPWPVKTPAQLEAERLAAEEAEQEAAAEAAEATKTEAAEGGDPPHSESANGSGR